VVVVTGGAVVVVEVVVLLGRVVVDVVDDLGLEVVVVEGFVVGGVVVGGVVVEDAAGLVAVEEFPPVWPEVPAAPVTRPPTARLTGAVWNARTPASPAAVAEEKMMARFIAALPCS
jgi:hypothetical protein